MAYKTCPVFIFGIGVFGALARQQEGWCETTSISFSMSFLVCLQDLPCLPENLCNKYFVDREEAQKKLHIVMIENRCHVKIFLDTFNLVPEAGQKLVYDSVFHVFSHQYLCNQLNQTQTLKSCQIFLCIVGRIGTCLKLANVKLIYMYYLTGVGLITCSEKRFSYKAAPNSILGLLLLKNYAALSTKGQKYFIYVFFKFWMFLSSGWGRERFTIFYLNQRFSSSIKDRIWCCVKNTSNHFSYKQLFLHLT